MSVEILNAGVIAGLAQIESDSVDCIVTSPPYWGLRDYGAEGQIGLEPTMGEHIETIVAVFEELRRLLKPEGTCWLNYGDAYASSVNGKTHMTEDGRVRSDRDDRTFTDKPMSTVGGYAKPKDLLMLPNRVAIALQEAGWWIRSEIVWYKSNPMPESVRDRPTQTHEKIFLMTKSQRYYFDAAAIREPVSPNTNARVSQNVAAQEGSRRANGGTRPDRPMKAMLGVSPKSAAEDDVYNKAKGSFHASTVLRVQERNARNVWEVASRPFSEAHFATFPPEIPERCIKAGCPRDGHVLDPFGGAGTTGLVAARLGRRATLIELNPEYAEMARRRIDSEDPHVEQAAPCGAVQLPMFTEESAV